MACSNRKSRGELLSTSEVQWSTTKSEWSCTRPLRIIPLVQKPGKMPLYHNDLRGHCHGVTPFLLPTRSVGAHMALHHVASQLARAKRAPANPASPAHQAQAFPRAQSVRGPDAQAALCVMCTRDRGDPVWSNNSYPPFLARLRPAIIPIGISPYPTIAAHLYQALPHDWEPRRRHLRGAVTVWPQALVGPHASLQWPQRD